MSSRIVFGFFALSAAVYGATVPNNGTASNACLQLKSEGRVQVFMSGDSEYSADINHYSPASIQQAACSVEPRTAQEVGDVVSLLSNFYSTSRVEFGCPQLSVIGKYRAPFAVKSGGHATNQDYSSTTGVQISMRNFNETTYFSGNSSVRVGPGRTWDQVYATINPLGVNVVGGRIPGVGVGGLLLGGGYSWLTNEHGLALDNILAMELVTPSGDVIEVTQQSQPNLYFALRGGYNNFGIVTSFTLKAFAQGTISAGTLTYDDAHFDDLSAALANWTSNPSKDPKAQAISTSANINGTTSWLISVYYNGPSLPDGIFDEFFSIPAVSNDFKQRTFVDFILSNDFPPGPRWAYNTVATLGYSKSLLAQIRNQTTFWAEQGKEHHGAGVEIAPEPFLPSLYSHSPSEAAYPHSPDLPLLPMAITFSWEAGAAEDDAFWIDAADQSAQVIYEQALREGQDIDVKKGKQIRYGNYALVGTPLEMIWGNNINRLRSIQQKVDPGKVMALAGGWKL